MKVFFKKIYKLAVWTSKYIFGALIVAICFLIKPFKNIRFGHIYTSRIGHLCSNIDNYIYRKLEKNLQEIAIFMPDSSVCNREIASMWQRHKNIYISSIAKYPLLFLKLCNPSSSMIISFQKELGPKFTLTSTGISNILIGASDLIKYNNMLEDLNLTKPFVCFHNRDSAYMSRHGLDMLDKNYHDYRDFEFDDYKSAINQLHKDGIHSVRLGETIKKASEIEKHELLSLTGSNKYDLGIIYNCLFFVGTNSGFSNVSRILRKPQLLVNYIPFELDRLSIYAWGSIILPKKLWSKSKNRYLTFSEMNLLPYSIHYQGDFYQDMGLEVIDNTEQEISESVKEMQKRIKGDWYDSTLQSDLQMAFWESMKNIPFANETKNSLNILISSTFLEKNAFMI